MHLESLFRHEQHKGLRMDGAINEMFDFFLVIEDTHGIHTKT